MATTPDTAAPALPIVPTHEEQLLRETVRQICAGFGPDYTRRKVAEDEPPRELWDALASRGFLGVNLPEEYGGGGLGMSTLAAGHRGRYDEGRVCDHRARRGLQFTQHLYLGATRERRLRAARREDLHLG